jgi:hypothetical protein
MYKKHILILMLLGIGLASLVLKFDQVKATAYGTGEPAGLTSNMTGNMTGNATTSGEESLPTTDPAGADLGRENPTQEPVS